MKKQKYLYFINLFFYGEYYPYLQVKTPVLIVIHLLTSI